MMNVKKYIILFLVLGFSKLYSQMPNRGCGTGVPTAQYDSLFQQQVLDYLNNSSAISRVQTTYQIPVIIHVIHGGQAIGVYPNLAQAQLNSQIQVLNDDYGGVGFNSGTYPATAFQTYATNALIAAASKDGAGRIGISNTGITFCLAGKDSVGNILAEPGIERKHWSSISGASNPTSFSTSATFSSFMDNVVKPATIWSPNKYLNIWVTDANASTGLIGFATFPTLSGLSGISGGGTATTDGLWCKANVVGSQAIFPSGTYDAVYKYGRTATHELSHYFGIRHTWGDATCATDYCNDTPAGVGPTYGTQTYPYLPNNCPTNSPPTGAEGLMFMNFADYSDDVAMYMFTDEQRTRMQTVMVNSPYRKLLGTHGLCFSLTSNFSLSSSSILTGQSVSITDLSTSTSAITSWSYTCGASTPTSSTLQNPSLTFNTPGTHTITLTVNSSGVFASSSKTIQVTSCPTPTSIVNITNPSCNGACNGSAVLNSSGGPPFTYSWTPSVASTSVATNLCAGNYTCVVTNSCGVSITKSITITPPPAINVSIIPSSTAVCIGNGVDLTASASGGTGTSYTYNWSSGSSVSSTSVIPTIMPTTNYTVTVQDLNGCVKTATIGINVNPIPSITVTPSNPTICAGKTATLNLTGALNYTTNPGNYTTSSFTVNPTATTIYTVTGVSSFGCQGSTSSNVNVVAMPIVSINSPSTSVCMGYTMAVTANGSNNYNWSTGATTNTIVVQPFTNTSYSVVGTNGGTCSDTAFLNLTVMPLPSVSASASSTTACVGQTVSLMASGNSVNYLWQPNNLFGASHVVQITAPITYTVYGQGANGCAFLSTVFINAQSGTAVIPVSTPSAVCAGDSAVLSVIGGYVPMWNSNPIPNTTIVTPTVNSTYTLNAVDFNGCSSDIVFTVDINLDCNVIVYNGFTPNGDGINDFWVIENLQKHPNNKVHVFNRWGNELFNTVNYNNANNRWDGKSNSGQTVINGTYFYIILDDSDKILQKGWIEITN